MIPVPNSVLLEPAGVDGVGSAEQVLVLDPLRWPEWNSILLSRNTRSFFHLSSWARVLKETYGHQPVFFCLFAGGDLSGLLPVMEVSNIWTGRKGVSMPFTDFCRPLTTSPEDEMTLYNAALDYGRRRKWRVVECRSPTLGWKGASASTSFWGHTIRLEEGSQRAFEKFRSPVRCAIRKAEKSDIRIEFNTDLNAMRGFYSLHCVTRSRHGVPCQAFAFFENIVRFVMAEGKGFIASAIHQGRRIAAAVFFQEGSEAIYKFGASDYSFQRLRPNNLLFWEAIKKCAEAGATRLHLGRTSLSHHGLRRFKQGFGACEEQIHYVRFDFKHQAFVRQTDHAQAWLPQLVFRCFPQPLFRLTGRLLYPHLA